MGYAQVVRKIAAPADAVWILLSWRGMAQLVGDGLFEKVEFDHDGVVPGTTKRLYTAIGSPIRERLEWIDEGATSYGYRVIDNGDLPVTDYVGTLRITPAGPDACTVLIHSSFVGVTVTDDEWAQTWEAMEGALLDAVAARFKQVEA